MIFTSQLTQINGVATNSPANVIVTVGPRMHGSDLFITSAGVPIALNDSLLTKLQIYTDAETLVDWDWTSLLNYALRKGIPLAVGQIPIFFSDPTNVGLRNAYRASLDTHPEQGIKTLNFKVYLGNITTPGIAGLLYSDSYYNKRKMKVKNATTGVVTRETVVYNTPIRKFNQTEILGTGVQNIVDIDISYPMDTITLYNGADANISFIQVKANRVILFEGPPAQLARRFIAYGVETPAGCIVLPFTYDRFGPRSAPQLSDLTIQVTVSTAFTCRVAVEQQLDAVN